MYMTESVKKIIANNVKNLIAYQFKDAAKRPTQQYLGKKFGISQRSVSYLLDESSSVENMKTDTIEAIANYFGLEPYQLMIPNLPIEESLNNQIKKVIQCYTSTTPEGRDNIARIAENELRYCATPPTNPNKLC